MAQEKQTKKADVATEAAQAASKGDKPTKSLPAHPQSLEKVLEWLEKIKPLTLDEAMLLAQRDMPPLNMSGIDNYHTRANGEPAKYSTLHDVISVIVPSLNKFGIQFSQPYYIEEREDIQTLPDGSVVKTINTEERLSTIVQKGDEIEVLSDQVLQNYTDEKKRGAQLTYFKRQQALGAFGLAGEDFDAAETTPSREPDYFYYNDEPSGMSSEYQKEEQRARIEAERQKLLTSIKERMAIADGYGITPEEIKEWTAENIKLPTSHMAPLQLQSTLDFINERIKEEQEYTEALPEPQDAFSETIPYD